MALLTVIAILFLIGVGIAYALGFRRRFEEAGAPREGPVPVHAVPRTNPRLRGLTVLERSRYSEEWERILARFPEVSADSLRDADRLVAEVLKARGGNTESPAMMEKNLTVNFPGLAKEYRSARVVLLRSAQGNAGPEELRRAIGNYRRILTGLLEEETLRRAA